MLVVSCLDLLKYIENEEREKKKHTKNEINDDNNEQKKNNTFQSIDLCRSFIFFDLIYQIGTITMFFWTELAVEIDE